MTVSIIIPVYNTEAYLRDCINSCVNQTVKFDQIILIDDGSTDTSSMICFEYSLKFNNILFLQQKNQGQSKARNFGLSKVTSEYVTFLDSDDVLDLDTLKIFINDCNNSRYDIYRFKHIDCDINLRPFNNKSRIITFQKFLYNGINYIEHMIDLRAYDVIPVINIINTKFLQNNSIQFPEKTVFEDHLFTIKILTKAKTVFQLNHKFYFYRHRNGSTTTSINKSKLYQFLDIIYLMHDYLREFNYNTLHKATLKPLQLSLNLFISFFLTLSNKDQREVYRKIDRNRLKFITTINYLNKFVFIQNYLFYVSPLIMKLFRKIVKIFINLFRFKK